MPSNITIRIAGEGGEGVISTGDLLTIAAARTRHDVYTYRTYPAEIKGGPAMYQLRLSDQPVLSVGTAVDILMAFNEEAFTLHSSSLKKDGLLVFDVTTFDPSKSTAKGITIQGIPLSAIAADKVGLKRSKNMVALGYLAALTGISLPDIQKVVREKFSDKGEEVLAKNLLAVDAGYEFGQKNPLAKDFIVPPSVRTDQKVIMSGNEAIAAGAVAAGCRFYAGYPITPASDILSFMEKELPKFNGVALQTEDEIAAAAACVGASFAGTKSLTATSGPGLSLMSEILGLASMTETPFVIVDAQRSGPSTGMPTKNEQSDLSFAVHMGHGDAPRVVLAPSHVKDCFYGLIKAFNMAEKYQIPVVVLSDQSLSHRTQTFTRPKMDTLHVEERVRASANGAYQRFQHTKNGVSPTSVPGDKGMAFVTTGLEHDELGHPSWDAKNHERMSAKRHRKLAFIAEEPGFTYTFGEEQATVGLLCWGSTEGPAEEAVLVAKRHGLNVRGMTLKMLHPLPEKEILEFMKGLKRIVVPEINFTGQLSQLLRAKFLFPFESMTKCTGNPFTPDEILSRLMEEKEYVQ